MAPLTRFLAHIILILLLLHLIRPLYKRVKTQYEDFLIPTTKVAFIPFGDTIPDSFGSYATLKSFFEDSHIKAIILFINSASNNAGTAEALAREIIEYKQQYTKPILAVSETVCSGAAYTIAAATDYIICGSCTLVGGIGSTSSLEACEAARQEISCSMVAFIQQQRSLTNNASLWAHGKIFTGCQAKALGLIDSIGSYSTALTFLKERIFLQGEIELVRADQLWHWKDVISILRNA